MFDIGWSEMAIVLLVALIVIGPKDLPRLARNMGQWAAKGRAMAREAELDKVKSEIEKAGRTDLGKTIEKTIDPSGELSRALEPPVLDGKPADNAPPAGAPATSAPATAAPAPATGTPAEPERSLATGAPTQLAAAAVAPAAAATSVTDAPASNGAAAATPRKRARRAPKASAEADPSTPAGNGTDGPDDRKKSTRATAPTEPS